MKIVLPMSNLQINWGLKLDYFQKGNQHTRGRWFIQGTKHLKDNKLYTLELHGGIFQLRVQNWHKWVWW